MTTYTYGNPRDESTSYTLIIRRVFGDNGHRRGVTGEDVYKVMNNLNWGTIQGIDMTERTDFKTGENYRMMFIRYIGDFIAQSDIMTKFEKGNDVKVTINKYGNFWKLSKYRDNKQKQQTPNIYAETEFPPLVVDNKQKEFQDDMDAFIDSLEQSTLNSQDYAILDQIHDEFEQNIFQNEYGYHNEDNVPMYIESPYVMSSKVFYY